MGIKEIAQKLAPGYWKRDQWNIEYFDSVEFSEALISAYKDELLKEVQGVQPELGEPAYWRGHVSGKTYKSLAISEDTDCRDIGFRCERLYTYDQVAAAISKATKPLEDQLAKAEQRVAEACSAYMLNKNYNSLEFDRKYSAKEFCAGQKSTVEFLAKMIHKGEWRKFVKEV